MRFSVPQFIDVEDKLFGQLTLKQGIYMLGSLGVTVAIFLKFGFFVAILIGAPVFFLAFLLAFVKVHGQPFINIFYSAILYTLKHKLYLWRKSAPTAKTPQVPDPEDIVKPNRPVSIGLTQSKLRELAWSLDAKKDFDSEDN